MRFLFYNGFEATDSLKAVYRSVKKILFIQSNISHSPICVADTKAPLY